MQGHAAARRALTARRAYRWATSTAAPRWASVPRIRTLTDRHTHTSPGEACGGGVHKQSNTIITKGSRHSRIRSGGAGVPRHAPVGGHRESRTTVSLSRRCTA